LILSASIYSVFWIALFLSGRKAEIFMAVHLVMMFQTTKKFLMFNGMAQKKPCRKGRVKASSIKGEHQLRDVIIILCFVKHNVC